MINVCILGSTGSIGESTLDVIARHPDLYRISVLTANTNIDKLFLQCQQFKPDIAVIANDTYATEFKKRIQQSNLNTEVLTGQQGLIQATRDPQNDIVVAAIVGASGLLPTLTAVRAGKKILLANKEALVMSGHLFIEETRRFHAQLLPIDSEHNALFQCLPCQYQGDLAEDGIDKIILTASGGPFRTTPFEDLKNITPEQAIAHPNWEMGKKISVDSATMMNKGLEVIEACWLFNASPEQVDVIIHPQSIIHSMVAYHDGSYLAQLGNPDMRTPIAHALAWPNRIESGVNKLDFASLSSLTFEKPDNARFPCLNLAYDAMKTGGTAPTILNAANEIAVAAFLNERIPFLAIHEVIHHTLNKTPIDEASQLDTIVGSDQKARNIAQSYINEQKYDE